MKIALTGASGHIGNCLVRELLALGHHVSVLIHNNRNQFDELDVTIIPGNLQNLESLKILCNDVDVVFHLAAQIALNNNDSKTIYETNVIGTQNIIDVALSAGVKKFIHFSSIDAFMPSADHRILDESSPIITSNKYIYAFTKAESERIVLKAVKNGLNAVILSPTAVIGPFDYQGSLFGKVLQQMYCQKLPFVVSGGYNLIDVRDVVRASIQTIDQSKSGEKYILSGSFSTFKNISSIIGKLSAGKTSIAIPIWLARIVGPFIWLFATFTNTPPLFTNHALTIIKNSSQNISHKKLNKDLNCFPRDLEQTLVDTIEWYKNNGYLN